MPLQQLAQQPLGRLVAPALDQHIEHDAVLVDGAPEIIGELLAKLEPPLADCLVTSITVTLVNLEVSAVTQSSLDRRFLHLSEPNSRRTRTEHIQNEGVFFGEKGTCNYNAS